jgi:tetratricopeptide (TPR) repeat protein
MTLAPTVTAEDSGELIAAAWHFGVPHPPGYPLWTALCGVWVHLLGVGSIAWRANLFSAACSAGAATIVFVALRQIQMSRLVAGSAALMWIWSETSWMQSVITEVYALNSLIIAGLFYCTMRWYATRKTRPLLVASLLAGLGMCNHHSIGFACLALVVWILTLQPSLLRRWKLIAQSIALLLVGLLPYAYLPIRAAAEPAMNWGDPSTFERFVKHVTRQQYGAIGPIKTPEPRSLERFGRQSWYMIETLAEDLTPWILVASVSGLFVMARRARVMLWFVVLWVACTGLLFVLLANFDLDRTARWALQVFFIPVSLGLAIAYGYVLEAIAELLTIAGPFTNAGLFKRASVQGKMATGATAVLALIAPGVLVATHYSTCNYSKYWYAEDHADNMLACMMDRAIIFPSGDHSTFPLVYKVLVEGERTDVTIADMYGYVRPDLVEDQPQDSTDPPAAWLIKTARRPVYFATKQAPPVPNAKFVTAGILYHLLPDAMSYDGTGLIDQCKYRNDETLTMQDFGATHIQYDHEFFKGLNLIESGQTDAALKHFATAAMHCQGIKEGFNNLGSTLAEHNHPEEAIPYFKQAANLDHRYLTPRRNLYRLYSKQSNWPNARNQLEEILETEPADWQANRDLGNLLADQFNDRQSAIKYWQQSFESNPNQVQLKVNIGE